MSDLSTVFKLLDLLQGHPGYGANCSQCGESMVDNLGVVTAETYTIDSRDGIHHSDAPDHRNCNKWWIEQTRDMERSMDRLKTNRIIDRAIEEFA